MHFVAIMTFLSTAVVPLVKKVLSALGIGAVTYVGINFVMDQAKAQVMAQLTGVSADVAQIMGRLASPSWDSFIDSRFCLMFSPTLMVALPGSLKSAI